MVDTSRMDRRLRVVLFADVAGFTELSTTDERGAIAAAEELRQIATEEIGGRGGRVVKHLGDGILAVFDGARHGVSAALELVSRFEAAAPDLAGHPLRLRVGLHMGEIVETESGDVFGDAVNRASRIQSAAAPGEVFVSAAVAGLLRQDPRFTFEDRGTRSLKGIAEEMTVLRATLRGADSASTAAAGSAAVSASRTSAPPATTHPLRDPRLRRWALAMGASVAVIGFTFLTMSTAASWGDGRPSEPTALPSAAQAVDTAGDVPPEAPPERPPLEAPAEETPAADVPPGPAEGATDEDGTDPEREAGGPEGEATAEVEDRRPLSAAEVEELYEWLFSDPEFVVRRLGDDAPLSEEEELLRTASLILAGRVDEARRRLAWLESSPARREVVGSVARAYLHFRAGSLDEVTDALAEPGAVTRTTLRPAAILRARILAAEGDIGAALATLERVPEAQRDDAWTGWQTWLRMRDGQTIRGLGQLRDRLRSLEGRREGEPAAQASERRYVNALIFDQGGNTALRDLFVQQGREDRLPAFLWVGVDPEWGRR